MQQEGQGRGGGRRRPHPGERRPRRLFLLCYERGERCQSVGQSANGIYHVRIHPSAPISLPSTRLGRGGRGAIDGYRRAVVGGKRRSRLRPVLGLVLLFPPGRRRRRRRARPPADGKRAAERRGDGEGEGAGAGGPRDAGDGGGGDGGGGRRRGEGRPATNGGDDEGGRRVERQRRHTPAAGKMLKC